MLFSVNSRPSYHWEPKLNIEKCFGGISSQKDAVAASLCETDCVHLLGKINPLLFHPSCNSLPLLFARNLPLVLLLRVTVTAVV